MAKAKTDLSSTLVCDLPTDVQKLVDIAMRLGPLYRALIRETVSKAFAKQLGDANPHPTPAEPTQALFGATLRRLREEKGFRSARALSLRAGLGSDYVRFMERGKGLPRWSKVIKLADTLCLSDAERAELYATYDEALKPESVREALSKEVA